MRVKVIAEIDFNISVFPDDVINYDTIGEYKEALDCEVGNSALHQLDHLMPHGTDIEIISAEPIEEGNDEYSEFLNRWQSEYNKKMGNYEEKRVCKSLG